MMKYDTIVPIGKSTIQHGFFNDRIYLMKIHPDDVVLIDQYLTDLQGLYQYAKIIMKVPLSLEKIYKTPDTIEEARIPGFYQGVEDALFLSRFLDPTRAEDDAHDKIQEIIQISLGKISVSKKGIHPVTWVMRKATMNDVTHICSLYRSVFETYPFPIQEPDYLKKIIQDGIEFFVGEISDRIVAAGSCEIDPYASAVEMSDLAVDEAYKGLGLSKKLLSYMEKQMKMKNVKTAYTICRAEPLPVNRLFAGAQYQYSGTLINNTQICGTYESMNIWYKTLH